MKKTTASFPPDFTWGAATASYQIEGAAFEDGKGLSVWDMLCRRPGAIWRGQSGEVACDHYHRYREDVALMREMGLKGYRFSISWPRVLPEGAGTVNAKGLDFYDRLVDELAQAGVEPFVTLFHWDCPYDLFCRGGWLNRDSADWFADYAAVVVEKLGDRVRHWMTLNEPQCFVGIGHATGIHAPGLKLATAEVLRAAHHVLLAHGKAVQVLRARGGTDCLIGYAPASYLSMPASETEEDIEAARRACFSVTGTHHRNNTWWMDPVYLGRYPEDGWALYGSDVPPVRDGDLEVISQPLDFFGCNIYSALPVSAGPDGTPREASLPVGNPLTAFRWNVTPEALRWGPRFFYERYKLPVYVTENGMSNADWVALDGGVHDPQRIDFTRRYLIELRKAIEDGTDVRGYFHWTLMDNFEWAEGFKERFGLIHVDYATQQRTPKDSFHWYGQVIQSNGACLD